MIDDDVEITAKFKLVEHDITINCAPSDKGCQATANLSTATKNTTVILTATAGVGYEFEG